MKWTKNAVLSLLLCIAILVLFVLMAVWLVPLLTMVAQNIRNEGQVAHYIKSMGAKAVLVIIGLQAMQVVIAFFPSAPIQILAGLCYGVWLGALLCLVGFIVGNFVVFYCVRHLQHFISPLLHHKKKHTENNKWFSAKAIHTMENPEYMAFLLVLVPGLPNGLLPYLFATTSISATRYLLSITAASIPSALVWAWLGARLADNDYVTAILIAVVTMALVAVLFLFKNKILAKLNSISNGKP